MPMKLRTAESDSQSADNSGDVVIPRAFPPSPSARDDTAERPFAGDTASFYTRYRRDYPSELVTRLLERCNRRSCLLDLGCGTGKLLLQLAGHFEHAVGIDPEPDMLREGARAALERGINNVEWVSGSSDDLPELVSDCRRFDLVTIGTAFHYMEASATLGALKQIAAGGAFACAYNGSPIWLHAEPWSQRVRSVLEARLGRLSDVDFTIETLSAAEATMRELDFTGIERWERSYVETIDVDYIVGHLLSATSVEQISPNQRQSFAEEVRRAIAAVAPSGKVAETVPVRPVIVHLNHN